LKSVCESCEQQLKPGWKICPYCSAPVAAVAAPAPKPAEPAAPPAAAAAATKTPRILVVDDDPVMRAIVTKAVSLLPQKPEILQASGGEEGYQIATEKKPDIILLDVMMPGVGGIEVCQKLRSNIETAFVPIIMLTANADEETRSKGFLVGTDDFMSKPISVPELHARLNRLLRRTYGI
jgi:putative two-component system response regulator